MKESILLLFGMVLVLAETIHSKSISDGGNDDDRGLRSADALKLQDETKAVKALDDNLERLLQLAVKNMIENRIENEDEGDSDEDEDAFSRITRNLAKSNRKNFWKRHISKSKGFW